jgi:hypothetical protein
MALKRLAGVALAALPALRQSDAVDAARSGKKKRRRKKKRKNPQPGPQVRADATCPLPQDQASTVGSLARLAQSFTAGIAGDLVRVDLGLDHPGDSKNSYLLRVAPLVDGLPSDSSLATAQVNAASVPAGVSQVTFSFASPARMVAGTSYALVLAVDGIDNFTWVSRFGTVCNGRAFLADGLSALFEPRNDRDFVFTTFVRV